MQDCHLIHNDNDDFHNIRRDPSSEYKYECGDGL